MKILGVDFTSSPRRAKPIVAAWGTLQGDVLHLDTLDTFDNWPAFDALLHTPGPWIGAFDLPFGLPREMVRDLDLPTTWPALVEHCAALGREGFRALIDAYRATRPVGQKFAHRETDHPAGSSSPMKLVNPPVALMFLEGTPHLLAAGVHLPMLHAGDTQRIALEGYPGLTARAISREPYKSDTRSAQTPARHAARSKLIAALQTGVPLGITLEAPAPLLARLAEDASGDCLDATLCALQAAWASQRRDARFGLPARVDAVEGWILTAGTGEQSALNKNARSC